jgi:hypothetical protein
MAADVITACPGSLKQKVIAKRIAALQGVPLSSAGPADGSSSSVQHSFLTSSEIQSIDREKPNSQLQLRIKTAKGGLKAGVLARGRGLGTSGGC